MGKKTFIFYDEFLDAIEHMTPDECKQFMMSIRAFRMGIEIPKFEDRYMQDKLDKALELLKKDGLHWEETRKKRSMAADQRWKNQKASDMHDDANASACIHDNENENETDTGQKPVEETPKKKTTYKPFNPDLGFITDQYMVGVMQSWLDYKRKRKESYKSQSSVEACYKKLMNLAAGNRETAAEIIEQSMANNWAGIFELKNNNGNTTNLTQYQRRVLAEQQFGQDLANRSAAEFASESEGSRENQPLFVPL